MEIGKVCKVTSIVLLVLDFIGSIVLGNTFALPGKYSFSDPSFNWAIFLCGVIAGFIFCLLIYALGEIIDQLECSNNNTYQLHQLLRRLTVEKNKAEPQKSYPTTSTPPAKKISYDGWICKECNTKNSSTAQFCRNCGKYK